MLKSGRRTCTLLSLCNLNFSLAINLSIVVKVVAFIDFNDDWMHRLDNLILKYKKKDSNYNESIIYSIKACIAASIS